MKTFENTLDKTFHFSSCDICDAACCKGHHGTIYSQLILEDFNEVFEHFPIVFMIGDLDYLKPVVLLTNGCDKCRYLLNERCSIYEKRPSVCKVYPLSPHLTNIPFIDLSCPAVGEKGEIIIDNGSIKKPFQHKVFKDYQNKYIDMHFHFEKFNKAENLKFLIEIRGNKFYKFKEDFEDEYLKLHLSSLKNLDKYFKI